MRAYALFLSAIACLSLTACKPGGSSKSYEDYPEFKEGGSMTLTVDGTPRTVRLDSIVFANTDPGYPDYIEVLGQNTSLYFDCAKSFNLDFDAENPYQPIVNVPLPITTPEPDEDKPTIQIPSVDTFEVLSGTVTMQKYQIGRDGNDWWEGQISLTLDAADGPLTVHGNFAWCIVPVW